MNVILVLLSFLVLHLLPLAHAKEGSLEAGVVGYLEESGDLVIEIHDDVSKRFFNAGVLWSAMNSGADEPDFKSISVPSLKIECHTIQTLQGRIGDCEIRVAKRKVGELMDDFTAIYTGEAGKELVYSLFKVPTLVPQFANESIGRMAGGLLLISMNYGSAHLVIDLDKRLMKQ